MTVAITYIIVGLLTTIACAIRDYLERSQYQSRYLMREEFGLYFWIVALWPLTWWVIIDYWVHERKRRR